MTVSWYALRSKPNKEDFLAGQLEAHAIQVYFPRLHAFPVNPRARKVKPYFPGYLFVYVDLDVVNISTLQWMPGALGLVGYGGEPAPVPDALISIVQKRVDELNVSNKASIDGFSRGDRVIVQDGPFAGYEAIFDHRISGQDRVRVLLSFLQKRQVPLELGNRQIRRVKRS
jgi:transcriptional antiterminator RfaH